MRYTKMTPAQIRAVFLTDVLGLEWWRGKERFKCHPLTDLNHAMLGMEKLIQDEKCKDIEMGLDSDGAWVHLYDDEWSLQLEVITKSLNVAIVEACIRIKRPDLFEED